MGAAPLSDCIITLQAPERMRDSRRHLLQPAGDLEAARTLDVWAFGLVLQYLVSGNTFFSESRGGDVSEDCKDADEERRLLNWTGVDSFVTVEEDEGEDLSRQVSSVTRMRKESWKDVSVAMSKEAEEEELEAVHDLVSWCLEPEPARRPQSMVQVLRGPHLKPTQRTSLALRCAFSQLCALACMSRRCSLTNSSSQAVDC